MILTEDERGTVAYCHRCQFTSAENVLTSAIGVAPIPRKRRAWPDLAGPLWDRATPICDTLAQTYLLRRGCALPPPDADLRFLPAHGEYPAAMIAKVTNAVSNTSMTLHFTELSPTGEKLGRRLLAGYPKAGGVIRLWPDSCVTRGLAVAEGIETCLSAAIAFTPIWATVDAGNMASFPVLQGIESLTIFADNDEAGLAAARCCGRRWRDAGREVRIKTPREFNDINDVTKDISYAAA